jgi:hypothetical protein
MVTVQSLDDLARPLSDLQLGDKLRDQAVLALLTADVAEAANATVPPAARVSPA